MRSIKFPHMFNSNSTRVWKSDEHLKATKQNTYLLLKCERNELFGDPYFGLLFKHFLFEQNSPILRDALIDMIHRQLVLFIPQLRIERSDIEIVQNKSGQRGSLWCTFRGINQITYEIDNYQLLLYSE